MIKNKAIALCRVSTSKQRIEGSSLQAQEARVYECAQYLDVNIEKLWSLDTSSRKGKNIARKDLNQMYEYAKHDKKIKYIVVDEADRFMRSIEEAYWWKVQFKSINVDLAYANMPEITHEDNPMAVMREMMAFFTAEMSNHERITKTTDKMQAKIQAGYYPGMVHQGYKKSNVRALHIPKEPEWSLLKAVIGKIVYNEMNLSEALQWLCINGYRMPSGRPLDMFKLKRLLKQPYYAGIVRMSNWDTICYKGLHTPMITVEEHERLVEIVDNKKKKFVVHHFNPAFLASNIVECSDCLVEQRSEARLVGYRHHNNKPVDKRKFYERYRCRSCGKNVLKSTLHGQMDKIFDKTELVVTDKELFLEVMKSTWKADLTDNVETVSRLKQRRTALAKDKDNLVRSLANNPDMADDFKLSIATIKVEIDELDLEIIKASSFEDDFDSFMAFALDYTSHIKQNWWGTEDPGDRIRLTQLVYPNGLSINRDGKVLTPELSPIYRYKSSKKTPQDAYFAANISFGGPGGA